LSRLSEGDSAGYPVELSFVDYGRGNPVVPIHGWPLCKESWEPQLAELPKCLRVIAYDRHGFGKSSKPWDGYDSDRLADDPNPVLDQLDLQDVTLVGFSMRRDVAGHTNPDAGCGRQIPGGLGGVAEKNGVSAPLLLQNFTDC
jgi:pimeloyl-ACP methyl ester carboxylesterase